MSMFLVSFFLVYGGAHAYALVKARCALGFGWGATLAALPFLLALMCAPIIVHHLSKHDLDQAAHVASWIGYLWMGLLFFFVWTNLALDAVNLAARAAGVLAGKGARPAIPYGRTTFLAMAGLAIALGAWSIVEASRIGTDRVRIVTDKLPPSVRRIRIAQISDVHFGLIVRARTAAAIARIVRAAAPDIFVATGDLVDARINHLEGIAEILAPIPAPLGKYAVTGNHEYYAGIEQALDFTRRAGFTVLPGEAVTPGGAIRLAGVDDEAAAAFGRAAIPESVALGGPSPLFTVLLKHRPVVRPAAVAPFDLQLSGHTHNGQLFPFRYLVRRVYPHLAGLYRLANGGGLYVSGGTGTWGPPMRFLSPPAVTIIDIERGPGA